MDIFEGGSKFSASESRNKLDSTASVVQREEERSSYPSNQEYKKFEGKPKSEFD